MMYIFLFVSYVQLYPVHYITIHTLNLTIRSSVHACFMSLEFSAYNLS